MRLVGFFWDPTPQLPPMPELLQMYVKFQPSSNISAYPVSITKYSKKTIFGLRVEYDGSKLPFLVAKFTCFISVNSFVLYIALFP